MHGLTKVAPLGGQRATPSEQREADDDREIRFLGDLHRLRPEPGDVFVLSVDHDLSGEQAKRIRECWEQAMGSAKVLVLGKGMHLGCVAAPADNVMTVHVGAHHIGITK